VIDVPDRTAEVQAWLDGRADEMATLLEALVRIPTSATSTRASTPSST
jgi:hypothetical protein